MKHCGYKLAAVLLSLILLAACAPAGSPAGTSAATPAAAKPAETTAKPAETTAEPSETTAKPSETTAKPAETTAELSETTAAPAVPADYAPDFHFSGVDQYGNSLDERIFASYKLTMINFWEPWCGPCVGEMPDLEQLHQAYPELLILGVYQTPEGVDSVLRETGVTYPVMPYDETFKACQTGYVPTTVFVDAAGHVVGEAQIGARNYSKWEAAVKELVGR